jgi:Uma2 family endonuclease
MGIDIQNIPSPAGPIPTDALWRLSIDQYHRMIETGILTENDPAEFLEGCLVSKMPKNPRHRLATQLLREIIARLLVAGWFVDAQEPITTADSEPEPDLVIVKGNRRDYTVRHPGPEDIALIVEVSDSTLAHDRSIKKRLYARAGIPTYWIVNLVENQVEIYTHPDFTGAEPDYLHRDDFSASDTIPLVVEGQELGIFAVSEILP